MLDRRILWLLGTIFRRRYAKIGWDSYLGPTLFVKARRKNLSIGRHVRIMAGSRLEILGKGAITIGDSTSIGHSLTCTCTDSRIEIGNNSVISGNVFIGTQNYDFRASRTQLDWFKNAEYENHIVLGENIFIGYGAVILGGTEIGDNSTINAYSVVKGQFPPNSIIRKS